MTATLFIAFSHRASEIIAFTENSCWTFALKFNVRVSCSTTSKTDNILYFYDWLLEHFPTKARSNTGVFSVSIDLLYYLNKYLLHIHNITTHTEQQSEALNLQLIFVHTLTYDHRLWVVSERTRSQIPAGRLASLCMIGWGVQQFQIVLLYTAGTLWSPFKTEISQYSHREDPSAC